jgi:hypothetical protein
MKLTTFLRHLKRLGVDIKEQEKIHKLALWAAGHDAPDIYSDTFEIGSNYIDYFHEGERIRVKV